VSDVENKIFDSYAEEYDSLQKKNLGVLGKDLTVFSQYKIKTVKRIIQNQPKTFLEFGCGIGRNIPFIQEFFPETQITACDVSQKSLTIAQKTNSDVNFFLIEKHGDIKSAINDLDCILVSGVMHHIKPTEHKEWLEELVAVLGEKGEIFIFEHNPYNPLTRHFFNTCPYDADAALIKPAYCENLLSKCGIRSCRRQYTLFFPWRSPFWENLEWFLGWCPLGGQYCVHGSKA
jgi:SAM-dependent methyltransferase